MDIIIDGRALQLYGLGQPAFHGGTESYVQRLASGLADAGHTIHVITPDLAHAEQRGPNLWYWTERNHPEDVDVVVAVHNLEHLGDTKAPLLIFASNGTDRPGGDISGVDAVAVFSQCHADLLTKNVPEFAGKYFVTGLGQDLPLWPRLTKPVYGRMLWGNDPSRGLWHMLDIFEAVLARVSDATLHVTYDFDRQFENWKWQASSVAELLWECQRRIVTNDAIISLGGVTDDDMQREKLECSIGVMPSDPQNVGSQIHGMLQMELAGYGVPLVLSDTEAFPEVFGEAARILPLPNTMARVKGKSSLGRIDANDWAEVVAELMRDPKKYTAASKASRALAEKHTWQAMIGRWLDMFATLQQPMEKAA